MGAAFWIGVGKFIAAVFGGAAYANAWAQFAVLVVRAALLAAAAKAFAPRLDLSRTAQEKLLTVRDPIFPQNLIYGEDMVSGPLLYANVYGTDNEFLMMVVAFCGHEIDSVQSYRFDDTDITLNQLSGAEDGTVDLGKFADTMEIGLAKGTATQTTLPLLTAELGATFTAAHRGRGWAYFAVKMELVDKDNTYQTGAPQNFRAVARGKKVYDPRLDTTNGGSGPHRLADDTTWEWSANPALCLADFLRDDKFGMAEIDARIDWPMVITAADVCEELVTIPGATTQDRYTCNSTFQSTERRTDIRDTLLNAMMGRMVFSQGLWRMWAGEPVAADVTLTEANLGGQIQLQASAGAKDRYNRVRGKFVDPSRDFTAAAYPEQRSSLYESDDGDEVRPLIADFHSTNNSFEAQRKAIIMLRQSRHQRIVIFNGNWSCYRVQPGATVELNIAEYGFAGEKFYVSEWSFNENGVTLALVEEQDSVWDDPGVGEYTIRTASGTLIFANQGVPPPTAPTLTPLIGGILVQWTNAPAYMMDSVEVWASDDNDRSNAVLLATVNGEQYFDQVSNIRFRFYWLRSLNEYSTKSLYEPNLTTTSLVALPLSLGTALEIPTFTPGMVGGKENFQYTLNATAGGTPNIGEIRVEGADFQHPDGTSISTAGADFSINTFYEDTVAGLFYIMYSAVVAETRFGGVAGDWGSGSPDDTRFCCVTWSSVDGWRARDNGGTYYAFTPIATDAIIAVCSKGGFTAGTGIDLIVPATGSLPGGDGTPGAPGDDGQSVYVAQIFKRSASAPSTPAVDDGSYNFTTNVLVPPSTWSDDPPAGSNPLYVSIGSFSVIGQSGTDNTVVWSTPALYVSDGTDGSDGAPGADGDDGGDGQSVFKAIVYRRATSAPSTPSVNDGQYNFTTNTLTPPSGWSTSPPSGTDLMYSSTGTFSIVGTTGIDTTVTWGAPEIFVGSANWSDVRFRRNNGQPATPTGDNPSGWFNQIPNGTNGLWSSTGLKNASGTLQGVWSTPALIQGLMYRGAYSGTETYYRFDFVTYQERSYVCVVTSTVGNAPSGTNSGNTQWDLLAGKGDTGDPPTVFTETIAVTGTGPVNLRNLADNHSPAYDGIADATITFTVASGITLTGVAGAGDGGDGGHAVDTGSWPAAATISLTLENEGTIRGGGGAGGDGGSAFGGINGSNGGDGGDAIFCQEDITIDNAPSGSGTIQAAGSGGGGGGGANYPDFEPIGRGGGGGGGAFTSGAGGDGGTGDGAPQNGDDGNDGTTSGGGTGGSGAGNAGNGGNGGGINAQGIGGTNGSGSHQNGTGGNAGTKGYAVRKNGNTVTATGGTITGTVG